MVWKSSSKIAGHYRICERQIPPSILQISVWKIPPMFDYNHRGLNKWRSKYLKFYQHFLGPYCIYFCYYHSFWSGYHIESSHHLSIFDHSDIGVFRLFGLVLIALGVVIYVLCSGSFVFIGKGTPIPFTPTKELIVTGLYRFVRNPLYISGVLVLTGEAILFQSVGIFIYCLVMFGIFNVHVLMEEALLADKFGAAYEQYRNSVPRWIPRLKPYKENDSESQ